MKKVSFILIFFMLLLLPCAVHSEEADNTENKNPVVFVYHIPDEEDAQDSDSDGQNSEQEEPQDIISDDVTADTSPDAINNEVEDDDELALYYIDEDGNYEVGDMYSDVLKGYAEYHEGEEDEVALDYSDNLIKIAIKQPQKVDVVNYTQLKTTPLKFYDNSYSKFYIPEFSIKPVSSSNSKEINGIRFGTTYSQYIDSGELEQTSGIFSSYKWKNLTLKTSYLKTVNSTNNTYNDKILFSPEIKINQYFTLGNNFTSDLTKQSQKAEIVISVNPLGKRDEDFMRFDFGISQSYNPVSDTLKNQFRFATRFNF